jgi:hypothetical protein
MFELLPLLKGWQYRTKTIINPETYTSKVISILDEQDKSGWFISAEVISDDKHLHMNMWIDGVLVATNSPMGFYYGGSRLMEGIPNTFLYGQRVPGTSTQLYGMSMYVTKGYPYNNRIKVDLETTKDKLYVYSYQAYYIEITDPELFKQGLREIYCCQPTLSTPISVSQPQVTIQPKR